MNAKDEFLFFTEKLPPVKCAVINLGDYTYTNIEGSVKKIFDKNILLKVNYTWHDWIAFLNELSFEYDDGYGGQELFGTIWFNDGTWAERGEYDGSEWLERRELPEIPTTLKNN